MVLAAQTISIIVPISTAIMPFLAVALNFRRNVLMAFAITDVFPVVPYIRVAVIHVVTRLVDVTIPRRGNDFDARRRRPLVNIELDDCCAATRSSDDAQACRENCRA